MAMGIDKYNAECRAIVMRYSSQWRTTVERLGRWIDFDNDYKTLNTPYMESVWWVFGQLWKKDLVYRGLKVMPYTTGCTTPLSNFEAGQAYKDVQDPAGESKSQTQSVFRLISLQSPSPSLSSTTLPSHSSPGRLLPGPFLPISPSASIPNSPTSKFTTKNETPSSSSAINSSAPSTRTSRGQSTKCWRRTREKKWSDGNMFLCSITSPNESVVILSRHRLY